MASDMKPSDDTRAEEDREAKRAHDAGRGPTAEEAKAAEKHDAVDDKTREGYEEMLERGANQKGEGKPGV